MHLSWISRGGRVPVSNRSRSAGGYRSLTLLLAILSLAGIKVWVWGNLLGRTVEEPPRVFRTSTASAQTAEKARPSPKANLEPAVKPAPDKAPEVKGEIPTSKEPDAPAPGPAGGTPSPPQADAKESAANAKAADVTLVKALRAKEAELRRRELRLEQQESRLERLRRDIERKVMELRAIQGKVESYVVQGKKLSEGRLKRLAKVYESSPPEKAGQLLSELDPTLAALLLLRMDGRKAGQIWGFVEQDKAIRISKEMTKLR